MKKAIICLSLLSATLFTACSGGGQKQEEFLDEAQVPEAVKAAFAAKYPTATDVKWEKETEDGKVEYEIGFKLDGNGKEAFFEENGNFIKEEH
ncbi:MAG: hypothetical protein JNL72_14720 [Flavipsychrobacter sp.]|nr:hypothetical protein [Flavipsychrobacter sp.]